MRNIISAFAALALAAITTPVLANTVSTLGDEDNTVCCWGQPDTTWYGQTVSFSDNVTLDSYTFRIDDFGSAISYNAHVYAWDGDSATGSALFSSAGSTSGVAGMNNYAVNTSMLDLMMGEYVLFFEATSVGDAAWASVSGSDPYVDGGFVFQNAFSGGITDPWTLSWGSAEDLAFSMEYSVNAIPLPAGGVLLLGGLGALAAMRRRKKAA